MRDILVGRPIPFALRPGTSTSTNLRGEVLLLQANKRPAPAEVVGQNPLNDFPIIAHAAGEKGLLSFFSFYQHQKISQNAARHGGKETFRPLMCLSETSCPHEFPHSEEIVDMPATTMSRTTHGRIIRCIQRITMCVVLRARTRLCEFQLIGAITPCKATASPHSLAFIVSFLTSSCFCPLHQDTP
jgi:hypothetical protein